MSTNKRFSEKFNSYLDGELLQEAKEWFESNKKKLEDLYKNPKLIHYIFEPFISIIDFKQSLLPRDIYKIITLVAVINSVLAGLPGKMGVGVFVSIGLEIWMAIKIAQFLNLTNLQTSEDILKFFTAIGSASITSIWIFKEILGFLFSLFSTIPLINPLIFAEFFATNFIGILFFLGFSQLKNGGKFKAHFLKSGNIAQELFRHQWSIIKNVFNLENLKYVFKKFWDYLNGNLPLDQKLLNGEIFSTIAMACLLSGEYQKLEGPLGEKFIEAIRLRWSAQFDENSSLEDIADRFREYDADQLPGVINTIKGKMFELLVEDQELKDGDNWSASLHSDESFPGSDVIFVNESSSESIEISLKAVSPDQTSIIERALIKYPDIPIMTTDEIAQVYESNPQVFGSGITHKELESITSENFDRLLNQIEPINEYRVVFGGVAFGTLSILYPFLIAYLKKNITEDQLKNVFHKILGDSGIKLATRISYAAILGPVFAWWLLARGVGGMVDMITPNTILKLSFHKN